ncbi:MAG: thiamine pyrophosphate-dependent enzyme, partial [Treponema sp.]|nr:thiamine pyrophosphate-dependent enzyme [Treponema sp.]
AFVVAQAGRPGPVLIDIPRDIAAAVCEWDKENLPVAANGSCGYIGRLAERGMRETFTDADIENAAAMIKESKRPVVYAGGGAILSGAAAEIKKIAELLNAPVALSLMGMGAFPGNHPLCTGLIGMHGTAASARAVRKSDLLIVAGARFSDRLTSHIEKFARNAKILHIDIDPAEINKNMQASASITGDLKTVLARLLKKLPSVMATEWNGEIEKWKTLIPQDHHRKTALHPRFVIQETAKALGAQAIAVTDVGQHQIWTAQFFPVNRPRSFISSGGMGAMGFGMGAAMGAKIANPGRPVALFTGDGCFRMNCIEMATLARCSIPVLIIIFNNRALGMVRQWQNFFYSAHYYETDLDDRCPDFIKLADACNVPGFRVTDEATFTEALGKSMKLLASGKPVIIEAVIDRDEKVLPMAGTMKAAEEDR